MSATTARLPGRPRLPLEGDVSTLDTWLATRSGGTYPTVREFDAAGYGRLYERLRVRLMDRGGHRALADERGLIMDRGGRPARSCSAR
jgi:hypothetical protein